MKRLSRLLLLLVPLAIGLAAGHAPSGAQTAQPTPSGRFAFADTTLLRDTLDLKFTRLFPLADSLGIVPDSLRALAVRYRMSLERMTFLADSLRVPVDSVGTIMLREQFNPLASKVQRLTALQYTSSYNIQQTTSTWTNASDWNLVRGPLFVRNTTNVSMDRFQAGGQVNLRQTRSSLTESGWKFSNNLSLGGRANLERFDSQNPGNLNNENGLTVHELPDTVDQLDHLHRFDLADLKISAGHTTEHVRECREVARLSGIQLVELGNDPAPQLYDLDADPGEVHNVAGAHSEIVDRLRKELDGR